MTLRGASASAVAELARTVAAARPGMRARLAVSFEAAEGPPAALVCRAQVCSAPIHAADALRAALLDESSR
ncbi:hypothetical protein [Nannocystis pusilla]|uniref:hypothetical protein n=1 Tax=Nannocystis pusilla TaxID=889268 RepID=UPI003B7E1AFC